MPNHHDCALADLLLGGVGVCHWRGPKNLMPHPLLYMHCYCHGNSRTLYAEAGEYVYSRVRARFLGGLGKRTSANPRNQEHTSGSGSRLCSASYSCGGNASRHHALLSTQSCDVNKHCVEYLQSHSICLSKHEPAGCGVAMLGCFHFSAGEAPTVLGSTSNSSQHTYPARVVDLRGHSGGLSLLEPEHGTKTVTIMTVTTPQWCGESRVA
ncbi:uncharacterized protein B0H18DRAFT_60041 [Fomitopsis serialis]|uniref:uncharacterized protein n=1 Tax=Fomitopsis serialis TaxID=139415 RepID=UPI00200762EB|nr:uncharacterized protein B0H18DRAFT_60041 [Neoantrodia serialis]KAH9916802.1 hypothetical protein B0H18DRAFT_60041 [Neoantrodia serialis]